VASQQEEHSCEQRRKPAHLAKSLERWMGIEIKGAEPRNTLFSLLIAV
jgi:hypothetical protein